MKIIRNILISLGVILCLFELFLYSTNNTFFNNVISGTILKGELSPDIDELHNFPFNTINNGEKEEWPKSKSYSTAVDTFTQTLMNKYNTVAFCVIHNDSLKFEYYSEKYGAYSLLNSFSMAKSFMAALIGIALHQGFIKNIDEPVSNYIENFNNGFKKQITIKHLLTMSSGLAFNESYLNPFSWPSKAYYGDDINSLTLNVELEGNPGQTWQYKGGDTQLLGIVLKRASGMSVATFASKYFWPYLHPEQPAFWSLDKENGMEKVSCCWYSSARDFARIAKLYKQMGFYGGHQLIDSNYIKESLKPAAIIKADGSKNIQYGYQWWILPHSNPSVYYCRGIRGQYIFLIPDKQLIVVRLGHRRSKEKDENDIPIDIYEYLNKAYQLCGIN